MNNSWFHIVTEIKLVNIKMCYNSTKSTNKLLWACKHHIVIEISILKTII